MNSRLEYVYIDASNYKIYQSVVLKGEFSRTQLEGIHEKLFDGEWFVPHQVGLPEKRFPDLNEDDGALFFFIGPEPTEDEADAELDMSCRELWENFMQVESWDLSFDAECCGT